MFIDKAWKKILGMSALPQFQRESGRQSLMMKREDFEKIRRTNNWYTKVNYNILISIPTLFFYLDLNKSVVIYNILDNFDDRLPDTSKATKESISKHVQHKIG